MELYVEDLDRSIAFYRKILGFELLRRNVGYASIQRGSVNLGLFPIGKLAESGGYFTSGMLMESRGLGVEIIFEVDDLMAAHAHVTAADYPILEPLQRRPWGLTDFYIADPDGYYIRITEREPAHATSE